MDSIVTSYSGTYRNPQLQNSIEYTISIESL